MTSAWLNYPFTEKHISNFFKISGILTIMTTFGKKTQCIVVDQKKIHLESVHSRTASHKQACIKTSVFLFFAKKKKSPVMMYVF